MSEETWHESLPEDMRGNESLAQIPDIQTLAKGYLDAQTYAGGAIRIPSNEAGEDDWSAFNKKLKDKVPTLLNLPGDEEAAKAALFARLGRPETAEGYEGYDTAPEDLKQFLDFAHQTGLSNAQVKGWLDHRAEAESASQEQAENDASEAVDLLKKEWGHAYEKKLSDAKKAVTAYADQETQQFLTESGLSENPGMIRLMAAIGATLTEEQTANLDGVNQFTMSPAEAKERIAEIYNNSNHPYHTGRNQDAEANMAKLFAIAHPEE